MGSIHRNDVLQAGRLIHHFLLPLIGNGFGVLFVTLQIDLIASAYKTTMCLRPLSTLFLQNSLLGVGWLATQLWVSNNLHLLSHGFTSVHTTPGSLAWAWVLLLAWQAFMSSTLLDRSHAVLSPWLCNIIWVWVLHTPSALLLRLRTALDIQRLLFLGTDFRIGFSSFMKNNVGSLVRTALTLKVIFTILTSLSQN